MPLLKAQSGLPEIRGAKSGGLGGLGVSFQEPDGYLSNSSALGSLHEGAVSVHTQSRFAGTGIRAGSVQAILPSGSKAAFGLNMEWYGLPEYLQQLLRFGHGRALSPRLTIGASLHYMSWHISQAEPRRKFGFDVGLSYKINSGLWFSWSSFSPFIQGKGAHPASQGTHLAGLNYTISKLVFLYAEWEKTDNRPWKTRVALEYRIVPVLSLRMGVSTKPAGMGGGFGLQLDPRMALDISMAFHPALGVSPSLSLRYIFVSKENTTEK